METRRTLLRTASLMALVALLAILVVVSTGEEETPGHDRKIVTTFSLAARPAEFQRAVVEVAPSVVDAETGPVAESPLRIWAPDSATGDSGDAVAATEEGRDEGVTFDRIYSRNGSLRQEKRYENGRLNGPTITYFQNGATQVVTPYVDGTIQGRQKTLFMDGSLQSEVTFVDGQMHGDQVHYYMDGTPRQKIEWVDGKREGMIRSWHRSGALQSEGRFRDGKAGGEHKTYRDDGILWKVNTYDGATGAFKSQRSFDRNGELERVYLQVGRRGVVVYDSRRGIDRRDEYPELGY